METNLDINVLRDFAYMMDQIVSERIPAVKVKVKRKLLFFNPITSFLINTKMMVNAELTNIRKALELFGAIKVSNNGDNVSNNGDIELWEMKGIWKNTYKSS